MFKDERDAKRHPGSPKQVLFLSLFLEAMPTRQSDENSKKKYLFELIQKDELTDMSDTEPANHIFQTDTAEDRDEWCESINNALVLYRKRMKDLNLKMKWTKTKQMQDRLNRILSFSLICKKLKGTEILDLVDSSKSINSPKI